MKKLITTILILLVFIKCSSYKFKTISILDINFEINNDTTQAKIKKANKYLDGKYKLILNTKTNRYSLCEFKHGKIIGLQKTYLNDVLTRTTEYKNGMKNGDEIIYDTTGKKRLLKIHYVKGKRLGQTSWDANGNEYYKKGTSISQEELELYKRNNKLE